MLTRWCDEYDDALKSAHEINQEINKLKAERSKTIRKFTSDEIGYKDKEAVVNDIDKEIADLEDKKVEADIYATQKEQIIDNALLFMQDPSEFWNRAPLQIQKRVQSTNFFGRFELRLRKWFWNRQSQRIVSVNKENSPE